MALIFFTGVNAVLAASPCDSMPPEILSNWNTIGTDNQTFYSNQYCGSGTGGSLGGLSAPITTGGSLGGVSAPGASTQLQNPIKYNTFSDFIAAVTKAAVVILLPFIVLAFIYSGFLFVKAQGNEAGLTEAKTAITYSMIGAFILLGAWGFAQIISQTVSTITK